MEIPKIIKPVIELTIFPITFTCGLLGLTGQILKQKVFPKSEQPKPESSPAAVIINGEQGGKKVI